MNAKALGLSGLPWGVATLGLVLMTATPAAAIPGPQTSANLRINCTGTTGCIDGATTQITTTGDIGTFGITNTGQAFTGTAFIIALEPDVTTFTGSVTLPATQSVTFSQAGFSSGFLSAFDSSLNLNSNMYQFSSLASASSQFLGYDPTSFFVKEWTTTLGYSGLGGSGTSNFANCCSFNNLANGTVILAFVKDANGNIINTPLSGSLTVPEPSSLLLLGLGLAGIGIWQRMRRKALTA